MVEEPVVQDNGAKIKAKIFRPAIGVIYLLGSFTIFALVMAGKADPDWRDVALMIVGALITKSGTIVDWCFGSSEDSSKKTDMLAAK